MSASCSASSARVSGASSMRRARGAALELGQQRAQRVAAVQLVGAVGGDDEHALGAQAAGQEGEEGARRAVGPVQVLDRQQRPAPRAPSRSSSVEQRLEEARLRRRVAVHDRRARVGRRELGQEAREPARVRRAELVERGVAVARERAQRGDERGVGQLALAELDAVAAERRGASAARARALELVDSRVLPTPDSPATKASDGRPAAASASAASSSASSRLRPMNRLLVTRVGTVPVSLDIVAEGM